MAIKPDCSYISDGVVGINPKYQKIIDTLSFGKRDDIMTLVNVSHFDLSVDNCYTNFFFPVSHSYRQHFATSTQINEFLGCMTNYNPLVPNYNGSMLMSYVSKGLLEVHKGKPNTYCLPADFFVSNDLKIQFKPDVEQLPHF